MQLILKISNEMRCGVVSKKGLNLHGLHGPLCMSEKTFARDSLDIKALWIY